MIHLGSLKLKNPLLLAPIQQYSDIAFRMMCYDYGCSYAFTELFPTSAFVKQKSPLKKFDFYDHCGLQFLANNAFELEKSIKMVVNNEVYPLLENIRSIDLNLGCPTKAVVDNGFGAGLLKRPEVVRQLFKTMKKHSPLPVSAKIRLAINAKHKKSKPYLRIAKIAREEGLDFITVHGRTASQLYEGEVDLAAIKEIHDSIDIPLVGNGNIIDMNSAKTMLDISDAIMIGRQALSNPFIFSQIEKGKDFKFDYKKEKMVCIRKYLVLANQYQIGFQHVRIHLQPLLDGVDNRIRKSLADARDMDQLMDLVNPIL